jgi:hypothetical protein
VRPKHQRMCICWAIGEADSCACRESQYDMFLARSGSIRSIYLCIYVYCTHLYIYIHCMCIITVYSMWLYYAHLYMSVLHCVFHVFHEHVITTSHTGYPHKYDGPWQFRIGSNQVSLVISYIFVDMITSYLTNLVITWRSYYIIYNICTCVYVYIYILTNHRIPT